MPDREWSNWEMLWPCVSLLAVAALGAVLGTGLSYIFGDL